VGSCELDNECSDSIKDNSLTSYVTINFKRIMIHGFSSMVNFVRSFVPKFVCGEHFPTVQ